MNRETDARMVRESLRGNREAFASLVRKYQGYAYGTGISMLSDFDLARDVAQEAFLRAYRDLHKLRDPARFSHWLHGIVRNVAHRMLRERRRVRSMSEELASSLELRAPGPSPLQAVQRAEERAMVRGALARLGAKNREALSLFYVDDLSYREIASYLDVTEATVRGRLEHGRGELREELNMVAKEFSERQLPEEFPAQLSALLDAVAELREKHEKAVRRLTEMGAPAVAPLCGALQDARASVRLVAAEALCVIGDDRALGPMLAFLTASDDETLPQGGVRRKMDMPDVRDFLIRMAHEGPERLQGACIVLVASKLGDEKACKQILEIFRNKSLPVGTRFHAVRALCDLNPEVASEFAYEALRDDALRSREAWLIAANLGGRIPIDLCLPGFARSITPFGRFLAGRLVLEHGEEGVRALEKVIRKGSSDERATAAVALADRAHPEAFDALMSELLRGCRDRKWLHLVERKLVRNFTDKLLEWAGEAQPEKLKRPEVVQVVARARFALARGATDDILLWGAPEERKRALQKLGQEQGAESLPVLRRCLRDGRPQKVTREAMRWMRRLKGAAMPVVMDMLGSEHWTERKAAACLLRQWGELTQEARVRALSDPHIAVRHGAAGCHPDDSRRVRLEVRWSPSGYVQDRMDSSRHQQQC
jgi:RNA polymerase sigma-70 factor (ECF subfamily)